MRPRHVLPAQLCCLPVQLLAQAVTLAPLNPAITAPATCQVFTATFTNAKGTVRAASFLWSVSNTTDFLADSTGRVCLRGNAVSSPLQTTVSATIAGRKLQGSTMLTVQPPASPTAILAQPGPVAAFPSPGRPTATLAQPDTTASQSGPEARISPLPSKDLPQRSLPGGPPTGLTASSGSPVSATISWTEVRGALGYNVGRSTSPEGPFYVPHWFPLEATATSFTDTRLEPATTYFWTVSALYPGQEEYSYESRESSAVSATTVPLKNPADFTARIGKPGEINFSWSPQGAAAYYMLQGDGSIAYQVNGTSFTVPNLSPGVRNFTLIAYYPGNGPNQYVGDSAHPSKVSAAALPKNTVAWLSKPRGAGTPGEAANYYNVVGATPQKDNLTKWKMANGFPAQGPAPDEVRARYFNAQDLNLGRDTHCRIAGSHLACYQNNSGPEPGSVEFPDADKALGEMVRGDPPFATVAMDQTANGTVNFYAYNKDGLLVQAAALDTEGPKAMPNVCTACHGGRYDANTHTVSGASFLPFDVFGFKFASASGYTLNDQQEAFRKLNAMVKSTHPNSTNPHSPIVTFIGNSGPRARCIFPATGPIPALSM